MTNAASLHGETDYGGLADCNTLKAFFVQLHEQIMLM